MCRNEYPDGEEAGEEGSATPDKEFLASVVTGLYDCDVECFEETVYAQLYNQIFPVP